MGILDKFFGKKAHSPLESTHPLAKHLDKIQEPLKDLVDQAKDSIEVVPKDSTTYVFIGKPPRQFGIAWVKDGQIYNLKKLAQEKGLTPSTLAKTSSDLSDAYKRSQEDPRYSTKVGSRSCLVASSETLGKEVSRIIQSVSN